jgi:hypothetical protein
MRIYIIFILFVGLSFIDVLRSLRLDITFGSFTLLSTINFTPVYIPMIEKEESFSPVSEWSLFSDRANKLMNGTGKITINSRLSPADKYDYSKVTSSFAKGKVSTSSVSLPIFCNLKSYITLKIDEIVFFNGIFNVYVTITCGGNPKSDIGMKTGSSSTKFVKSAKPAEEKLKKIKAHNIKSIAQKISSKASKASPNKTHQPFALKKLIDSKPTVSRGVQHKKLFGINSSSEKFNLQGVDVKNKRDVIGEVKVDQE